MNTMLPFFWKAKAKKTMVLHSFAALVGPFAYLPLDSR